MRNRQSSNISVVVYVEINELKVRHKIISKKNFIFIYIYISVSL